MLVLMVTNHLQEQQQSKPSCVKVRGESGELDLFDDGNTARAFRFDHCFDSSTGGATQVGQNEHGTHTGHVLLWS